MSILTPSAHQLASIKCPLSAKRQTFTNNRHLDRTQMEITKAPEAVGPADHFPYLGEHWIMMTSLRRVMPRRGKVGKQRIEDAGTLYPKRMETVDEEIRDMSFKWLDKAKADGKPFFLWLNPTRMHVVTHLSVKYQKMCNSQNGWSIQEAGMAQLDDIVGDVMKKLQDMGVDNNTIVVFTTDNGTETFTWPDGGNTPFKGQKGTKVVSACRLSCVGLARCRQARSKMALSRGSIGSRHSSPLPAIQTSRRSY